MIYSFRKLLFGLSALAAFYVLGLATLDVVGAIDAIVSPSQFQSVDTRKFAEPIEKINNRLEPYKNESSVAGFTRTLNYEPGFEELAQSGGDLVDQALTYLAQPGHTPLERRIAVHVIHKVPVSEWVRFANIMIDRYEKNQVDYWELEDTIYPRRFYSQHATDDFWRPDVRHVLYRFYIAHDVDRFSDNIKTMIIMSLTGLDTLLDTLFYCPRCA